jgi:hypothetical protein
MLMACQMAIAQPPTSADDRLGRIYMRNFLFHQARDTYCLRQHFEHDKRKTLSAGKYFIFALRRVERSRSFGFAAISYSIYFAPR